MLLNRVSRRAFPFPVLLRLRRNHLTYELLEARFIPQVFEFRIRRIASLGWSVHGFVGKRDGSIFCPGWHRPLDLGWDPAPLG
jgi:hypothetical protein